MRKRKGIACPCFRCRRTAKLVGRRLVRSLLTESWVESTDYGDAGFERGAWIVAIETSRLRFFDRVRVYFHDNELWFPLLMRFRIRVAVRLRLLAAAMIGIDDGFDE